MDDIFKNIDKVKPSTTPKQVVSPVKIKKKDTETSFLVWLDNDLLKALKQKALDSNTSIKKLIETAIKQSM